MLDRIGLYVRAGGAADIFPRIVVDQQRRLGNEVWTYGAANAVGTSNHLFKRGRRAPLPWAVADYFPGRVCNRGGTCLRDVIRRPIA